MYVIVDIYGRWGPEKTIPWTVWVEELGIVLPFPSALAPIGEGVEGISKLLDIDRLTARVGRWLRIDDVGAKRSVHDWDSFRDSAVNFPTDYTSRSRLEPIRQARWWGH